MNVRTSNIHKRKLPTFSACVDTPQSFRKKLVEQLHDFLNFDAACITTVDPSTHLSTGAETDDSLEIIHQRLLEYEYLHTDFNHFQQLKKEFEPVATLSQVTDGILEKSSRYRHVLFPAGFKDEMRAVLRYKEMYWGHIVLFRRHGRPLFHEDERNLLLSLGPLIAYELRKIHLRSPTVKMNKLNKRQTPGVLILSDQFTTLSSNSTANDWLSLLRKWEGINNDLLPTPILAVCLKALAVGEDTSINANTAKVCLSTGEGHYLTILGSKLTGVSNSQQIAISFELAKPIDALPYILEAYGLSIREKELLEQILMGLSTKELSNALHISTYTVQDHLKSIFSKTGVTSRRELVWKLLNQFEF